MKVYVAQYAHRYDDADLRVFSCAEAAYEWKRLVAAEWWSEWFGNDPPKPFTSEHADEYFDARVDEWFSVTACPVESSAD